MEYSRRGHGQCFLRIAGHRVATVEEMKLELEAGCGKGLKLHPEASAPKLASSPQPSSEAAWYGTLVTDAALDPSEQLPHHLSGLMRSR
jgi:sporulation protein YlmC with PRC-barrel domain